jgi:hypothetical protein
LESSEFSIEPFRSRKHEFRTDKGKKHCYPEQRISWIFRSHGQTESNLMLNQTSEHYTVMDKEKKFKNPPNMREYWRVHKREQRAQKKKVKECSEKKQ